MLARRALLLAAATGATAGRGAPAWKVFGSDHYQPFSYNAQGRAQGLLVERLQAAAARSGDRFDVELLAWPRALALAGEAQGGLLGVSYTAERADWLDFSLPLAQDELRLAVRRDRRLDFRSLADLRGLRIGMARGVTGGAAFDAAAAAGEFQLVRDWNAGQRLRALLAGRLDAAVMGSGRWGLEQVVRSTPELAGRRDELTLIERPLLRDALHLAFPKAMRAAALIGRFNAALSALPTGAGAQR